ncbi:uncharacterized protein [Physcomitrium patens]|uniref:Uncharacterized protein n=2 Tax=Physcomitrium patens TaxID=3218 RepID=A0A7I4CHX5_PHYPA|nr:uncharacterized protein LOC112276028 isoform X1 [Physcomitrium patens]|eukprot:XP_024362736.1 uncharacterized protein LOC112276028 isoform X1 [Physcomitrella patens]
MSAPSYCHGLFVFRLSRCCCGASDSESVEIGSSWGVIYEFGASDGYKFIQRAKMGVKPMSPSANFTTYRLPPPGKNNITNDTFGHHSYNLHRPKASSGLLRFLFCSRPCFQQSVDIDEDNTSADVDEENFYNSNLDTGSNDVDWNVRMELQAVMRHLEVRWQLFDEALSRFGDLEAMLAICADQVRWRYQKVNGVRDAQVSEDLKSLISRNLSMEVRINRITQLSSTGELGTSIDQDGYWGQLQSRDRARVQTALDFFYQSRGENGIDSLRSSRPVVLEEDSYVLCNRRGEVVEEGNQVVLWEQYNATWYIRGCVSYPTASTKLHA